MFGQTAPEEHTEQRASKNAYEHDSSDGPRTHRAPAYCPERASAWIESAMSRLMRARARL
jgi:hypothetical protein